MGGEGRRRLWRIKSLFDNSGYVKENMHVKKKTHEQENFINFSMHVSYKEGNAQAYHDIDEWHGQVY